MIRIEERDPAWDDPPTAVDLMADEDPEVAAEADAILDEVLEKYDPNQARAPKGSDTGGQWVEGGPLSAKSLRDLRAGEDLTPEEKKALEHGLQEFTRDVEERASIVTNEKINWKVTYHDGVSPSIEVEGIVEPIGAGGGRASLSLSVLTGDRRGLYLDYVRVPQVIGKAGMGLEIVDNIKRMSADAGWNDVYLTAMTSPKGTMVGAYVWAKMGVDFAAPQARLETAEAYTTYLQGLGLSSPLVKTHFTPGQLAADIVNGEPHGKRFLLTTKVAYDARLPV